MNAQTLSKPKQDDATPSFVARYAPPKEKSSLMVLKQETRSKAITHILAKIDLAQQQIQAQIVRSKSPETLHKLHISYGALALRARELEGKIQDIHGDDITDEHHEAPLHADAHEDPMHHGLHEVQGDLQELHHAHDRITDGSAKPQYSAARVM